MAANAEEIKAFLKKRGFETEVTEVKNGTFHISIYSKSSVDIVSGILAQISEGSRFIVSIHQDPDLLKLIEKKEREIREFCNLEIEQLQIKKCLDDIKTQCDANIEQQINQIGKTINQIRINLEDTSFQLSVKMDDESKANIKYTGQLYDELKKKIAQIDDRQTNEEQRPWWKKSWRRRK